MSYRLLFITLCCVVLVGQGDREQLRLAAAVNHLELACGEGPPPSTGFQDVSALHTHATSIACAARWGLVEGRADGTFDDSGHVTRGQATTILAGLLSVATSTPAAGGEADFSDLGGSVHAGGVASLAGRGYLSGFPDGTFRPNRPITRAQLTAVLVMLVEDLTATALPAAADLPTDVVDTDTHAATIRRAIGGGLASGRTDGSFAPNSAVSRAQMATVTMRAAGVLLESKALELPPDAYPVCVGDDATTREITRHGIRWSFRSSHPCGRYVNGDVWVVGPVTITDIDPAPTVSRVGPRHGSMLDPSPRDGSRVGYGSFRDVTYDPELDVATPLRRGDDLVVRPGSSLVSTSTTDDPDARPGIERAAVLTVVNEPVEADSFRPAYSGDGSASVHTLSDLRLERLPSLPPVAGAPHPLTLAGDFEQVWLDHVPGWQGRAIHPQASMPAYGRDLASRYGTGALAVLLDHPLEERRQLAINLVQIGIDLYGVLEDGGERNWVPNGGHAQGRKLPILLAGYLLDDPAMLGIGRREDVVFGEDAQTFIVGPEDVARGVGYGPDDIGLAEWGIRHATDPSRDDPSWDASYRRCCTANSWAGHVLVARLLGLEEAWNHEPLFRYTDRYVATEAPGTTQRFSDRPFTEAMWERYG